MIFYDPLADIEFICYTLKVCAHEKLAKAKNTEDTKLYLGEISAYNKILNSIKEMRDANDA